VHCLPIARRDTVVKHDLHSESVSLRRVTVGRRPSPGREKTNPDFPRRTGARRACTDRHFFANRLTKERKASLGEPGPEMYHLLLQRPTWALRLEFGLRLVKRYLGLSWKAPPTSGRVERSMMLRLRT
jgi:hypothetical protein